MIEFLINKDDIIKVIDKFVKKYEIEKSMAEAIYDNIKNTSYPPEDNDDNEEENKDNKNNINKRPKSQSVIVKAQDTQKTDKRSKSFKKKDNSNINKEEQKVGAPIVNSKNKAEYVGAIKGTSITIDVKPPIILLRSIDKTGKISTKLFDVFEDEEPKLTLNENLNSLDLTKNILDICLKHKTKEIKEIDDKNNKKMADNILLYALKKTSLKPQ